MCWLKKLFFGFGIVIIDNARKIGVPGKLPASAIPDLGIESDINNLVFNFDYYLEKEPKIILIYQN